jgi:hypothetical protein
MLERIVTVQIREEEKCLAKTHLAEVLAVSVSTINKWTKQGKLSGITDTKYTRQDILRILEILDPVPLPKLSKKNEVRWCECVESKLVVHKNGLFAIAPSIEIDYRKIDRIIAERGVWDAQGINNHEHIDSYAKNPILQLVLAEKLIESWIRKVMALPLNKETVVIYWNGRVDSTVCLYLMSEMNEAFLKNFDRQLGIKKCNISQGEPVGTSYIPPVKQTKP